MKIAALQMDIAWHDRQANYAKVRKFVKKAKEAGSDLLILPEMFSTGFSIDTSITVESLNGDTPEFLRSIARENSINVIGGLVLSRYSGGPQNVSLAIDRKGNDVALYAKTHLISILDEDTSYESGDRPVTFNLDGISMGCFICYDLRFPELFRAVVDRCMLIIVIASWPDARQGHWETLLKARAIENQCYVIGVNRVGEGGGYSFIGSSAIIDPSGEAIAEGREKETLLVAEIDPEKVREIRSTYPFLKDIRQF